MREPEKRSFMVNVLGSEGVQVKLPETIDFVNDVETSMSIAAAGTLNQFFCPSDSVLNKLLGLLSCRRTRVFPV